MAEKISVNDVKPRPGVRTKLFIANETIGVGKIDLLELLGQVGSISAAAQKMNMSYKRAKFLLDSMQSGFQKNLFVVDRRGSGKLGVKLTPLGQDLIRRYRAHAHIVDKQSTEILAWMNLVQVAGNKHNSMNSTNEL